MADMKSTPNTPDARSCRAGPGCPVLPSLHGISELRQLARYLR